MILIAALSLSLFGHLPHLPALGHAKAPAPIVAGPRLPRRVGAWRVDGGVDRFAGTRGCAISAAGVSLQGDVLVFRVAARGDTRQALYRIDGGSPRAVADTFETLQARGFFPQRGWIVDPEGGEVALPAGVASGATTITIRPRSGQSPRRFKVAKLGEAIALARTAGCATSTP